MRARVIGIFLAGSLAGALLLYYLLWRTGGLVPRHWSARTTRDVVSGQGPTSLPRLPTIPFPTRAPSSAPEAVPATPGRWVPTREPLPTPSFSDFSLKGEHLKMPVEGAQTIDLKDNFNEMRDRTRRHEAIDILAPRGTPVLAAVDGKVAKLFTSREGGLTVYEFDREEAFAYYYAHLDRYAENLTEGMALRRGDRIGYVGTSGNAPGGTSHLHFAIFRLGPEKRWWQGTPVNPYPLLLGSR